MKPFELTHVVRRLRAAFRDPTLILPYFDGTADPLARGIAYYVVPRKRPNPKTLWFHELPSIKNSKLFIPGYALCGDICYLVSWPKLLAQGKLPANPLTKAVHSLLWFLLPVVEQYDAILATELRLWRTRYDAALPEAKANPLFVGQGITADEIERFNDHLERVLNEPGFLRHASATLNKSLDRALCPEPLRALRMMCGEPDFMEGLVLLEDEVLEENTGLTGEIVAPSRYKHVEDGWAQFIRYIVDGFSGTDGCWRPRMPRGYGLNVLVNWQKLVEICEAQGWGSIITSPLELNYTPFLAGAMARQSFDRYTNGGCVAKRVRPLSELIAETGAVPPEGVETPWELYSVTALYELLSNYISRVERLKVVRRLHRETFKPRVFRPTVLTRDYTGHAIQVIQRKVRSVVEPLFTLPYPLPREYNDRRAHAKRRYRYAGTDFWTVQGINTHANGVKELEIPRVADAIAFRDWAVKEAMLLADGGFKKALFEQNYGSRVLEKRNNEREHLGFFAHEEDRTLREFFELRDQGSLTAKELKNFENTMPGRSLRAILRRRDQLGFQYALKHGYAAYTRSGYCVQRSVLRRKRWMRLGVPA